MYALYLMAAIGGVVMASANDLIVLFVGLETLSLAFYVLAASDRRRSRSQESGMKYFVLGGFSSAFFLYGIALLYGGTGSTNISEIVAHFQNTVDTQREDALVLAGVALMIVGLGFKAAAVPFHVWTPDVYEGAPTPVTAFMASAGKAAAFAAMLRVLVIALPFHRDDWRPVVWVLAVLSLVVGSALAVVQTNVKRMLAYSSISHAGFVLVGVEAAGHRAGEPDPGSGMPSVATYLLVYSVLVIGSFAVVALVERGRDGDSGLDSFKGLGGPPAGAGDRAHRVPPRPGGRAVDERLRRQVRRDPRRRRAAELRDRHHRHGRRRDRRLLVPADHGQRLARTGRRRGRAGAGAVHVGGWRSPVPPCSPCSSACGPAGSSTPPTPSPNTPANPRPRFCLLQIGVSAASDADSSGFQAGVRVDSRRSATRRATRSLLARRFISRSRACSPSASRPVTFSTFHCRSTTGTRICSWCTARS